MNAATAEAVNRAKDQTTLSEVACDLIVVAHRVRDLRHFTPDSLRTNLDAALDSISAALDALHVEHHHRIHREKP